MRIFVTGGAGYIGSHCVRMLLEEGHEVVVFDDLSTGHREVVPENVNFVLGDLTKPDDIRQAMKRYKPDAVMHFAAKCIIPESMADPVYYWEQNVVGTVNLLRAMEDARVDRLIFSSSVAVYGDPSEIPITESAALLPISPYGTTKVAAEMAIEDAGLTRKLHYFIFRYFNVGGAGLGVGSLAENETRLIPLSLRAAAGKQPSLKVFGTDYPTRDGSCIRDYIHVLDVADAHIAAIDYLAKGGESNLVNLGSHEGYTVLEIAELTKEITGRDFKVDLEGRREGDTATVLASNEKAREILGWFPKRGIREIIQSMWEWEQRSASSR